MNSKEKTGIIFIPIALVLLLIGFFIVPMMTGYNPDPEGVQTPLALFGLRITYFLTLVTIIFIIVGIILIIKGSKEIESYG